VCEREREGERERERERIERERVQRGCLEVKKCFWIHYEIA
jgi:hypothetical protein